MISRFVYGEFIGLKTAARHDFLRRMDFCWLRMLEWLAQLDSNIEYRKLISDGSGITR